MNIIYGTFLLGSELTTGTVLGIDGGHALI